MTESHKMNITNLNVWYGEKQALFDVSLDVHEHEVLAFIGPSGCGKSTLLKTLNRMNDLISGFKSEGSVSMEGTDIYSAPYDVVRLRKRVGMVFQQPNPFPKSIYENVAYGPRTHGIKKKKELLIYY